MAGPVRRLVSGFMLMICSRIVMQEVPPINGVGNKPLRP